MLNFGWINRPDPELFNMEHAAPSANPPLLSIVIPVRNDAAMIARCLSSLLSENGQFEIVVVDGESEDATILAASAFPEVKIISSPPGRARQMNAGIRVAYGDTFLFLPPDVELKPGWYEEVLRFESMPIFSCGTFPITFNSKRWCYRILSVLINGRTKFMKSPMGGQGILVRRSTFKELSGFRDWPMLESTDLFRRLRKRGRLYIASRKAEVSTGPWNREGIVRRWLRMSGILLLYKSGVSVYRLVHLHATQPLVVAVFSDHTPPETQNSIYSKSSLKNHRTLLVHTWKEACSSGASIFLYHPKEQHDRLFHNLLGLEVRCRVQAGSNLGRRLEFVFRDMVGATESPAMVVFSVSPFIRAELIKTAGEALKSHDAVMGRTNRGSMYLIGLSRFASGLFDHVSWNSSLSFDETIKRLQTFNFTVHQLPELRVLESEEQLAENVK